MAVQADDEALGAWWLCRIFQAVVIDCPQTSQPREFWAFRQGREGGVDPDGVAMLFQFVALSYIPVGHVAKTVNLYCFLKSC